MGQINFFRVVSTLVVALSLAGCVSTQSINEKYSAQLSRLAPGDSLSKFRELMPKAMAAGQNRVGGQRVDAYEVVHNHMYDQWWGFTREERLWFYFCDEKLVKWGPPGAWPEQADLVIEHRNR